MAASFLYHVIALACKGASQKILSKAKPPPTLTRGWPPHFLLSFSCTQLTLKMPFSGDPT